MDITKKLRLSRESRVVEILTIIMLTPTRWIGLGYGFGVEQYWHIKQKILSNIPQKNPYKVPSKETLLLLIGFLLKE